MGRSGWFSELHMPISACHAFSFIAGIQWEWGIGKASIDILHFFLSRTRRGFLRRSLERQKKISWL
jgi:hypothetical protein